MVYLQYVVDVLLLQAARQKNVCASSITWKGTSRQRSGKGAISSAAGVVPCGGPKLSPRTPSIVQIIFIYLGPLRSVKIFRVFKTLTFGKRYK